MLVTIIDEVSFEIRDGQLLIIYLLKFMGKHHIVQDILILEHSDPFFFFYKISTLHLSLKTHFFILTINFYKTHTSHSLLYLTYY